MLKRGWSRSPFESSGQKKSSMEKVQHQWLVVVERSRLELSLLIFLSSSQEAECDSPPKSSDQKPGSMECCDVKKEREKGRKEGRKEGEGGHACTWPSPSFQQQAQLSPWPWPASRGACDLQKVMALLRTKLEASTPSRTTNLIITSDALYR